MFNLNINEYDKKVYAEELRDFLPDSFIDLHVHIWRNYFTPQGDSNGGATWTHLVADEMSGEDLMDALPRLFPGKNVTPLVFGGVDHSVDQCNEYVREQALKYGFPTLLRTDYSMTPDRLEEQVKAGGFLGLKPYLTNCPPYLPSSEIRIYDYLPKEHLEVADRNGWIVMLHIPRSGRLRDRVNLAQLLEIEKNYPNLRLVVAHVGRAYSRQDLGDAFDLLKDTKNMLFDFTANLCDEAIETCIRNVGSERLMFGSDLPITVMRMYRTTDDTGFYYNIVPRGMYGDVSSDRHMRESDEETITLMIYEQLRAFRRVAGKLGLTDRQVEDIMFGNADRLIKG